MFTMNTDRLNSSESSATRPRPTRIESSAITTGTNPATRAPKTSTSTIIAAGRPKASSPFWRSLCEMLAKSLLTVWSPVIATAKPCVLAFFTSVTTGLIDESLGALSWITVA